MSRLTRDETAEPVSRDQILRHARGQENFNFPCSADLGELLLYMHTYIHTYIHTGDPMLLPSGNLFKYHEEDILSLQPIIPPN